MAINDLFILKINYQCVDAKCVCACAWRHATGPSLPDQAEDILTTFETAAKTKFLACLTSDVRLDNFTCYRVSPLPDLPGFIFYDHTTVGARSGNSIPANTPMNFFLRTDAANYKHNGHIFISGIPITAVEENRLTGTFISTYANPLAAVLGNDLVNTGGGHYAPVTLKRVVGGVKLVPPGYSSVTSCRVRDYLSRRRTRTRPEQGTY
jgi:hypothetical protein